ncbi:MAG TPA: SMP-30/gluconolactonase/LRE family protein [Acidobacteriota bacterium]
MKLGSRIQAAALAGAGLLLVLLWAPRSGKTADSGVTIERKDARLDALIPKDAQVERIVDGHDWVEGPLWDRTTGSLLFSDIPRNSIYRWKQQGGIALFLKPSGYTGSAPFLGPEPGSNGLLFDREGRLILCEHGDRRIARLESDGSKTTLVDRYQGRRLNSPNDAAFKSSGELYFTDPPFGLPKSFDDPGRELDFCGVYRWSPEGLTLLTRELAAPNGIAFSPDEGTLYLSNADPKRPVVLAFEVKPAGTLGVSRVLFDATPFLRRWPGGPDGLKVDRHGNLFAAGPGGIHVFAPDGTHLGSLITGSATGNCAWGEDGSTLFITSGHSVYRIRLTTRGA